MTPSEHEKDIETWRQQRVARLRADEGWLTLAGLFFLEPGAGNTFGSGADNAIVLPAHSAPPHAGHVVLAGSEVTVVAGAGTTLSIGDEVLAPGQRRILKTDEPGPADVVTLGDLRFFIITRDGRLALRLRDLKNPRRVDFPGLEYFPVRPEYRVTAQLVPHADNGTTIKITSVSGKVSDMKSPGKLVFTLGGERLSLDAVQEASNGTRLSVLFRDLTAGQETYGAGRFLYSEGLPRDGQVVLDFNKAYNPPCALTPFATCPLPPPQNRLKVRIEAGEKVPLDSDH